MASITSRETFLFTKSDIAKNPTPFQGGAHPLERERAGARCILLFHPLKPHIFLFFFSEDIFYWERSWGPWEILRKKSSVGAFPSKLFFSGVLLITSKTCVQYLFFANSTFLANSSLYDFFAKDLSCVKKVSALDVRVSVQKFSKAHSEDFPFNIFKMLWCTIHFLPEMEQRTEHSSLISILKARNYFKFKPDFVNQKVQISHYKTPTHGYWTNSAEH